MRRRLNFAPCDEDTPAMNVVVCAEGESVSLLVDEIGDVIEVDQRAFERSPNNLNPSVKDLIQGVYKLEGQLLLILDTHAVVGLAAEPEPAAHSV
jgi:purine-binding chemotaxis protein CheW